MPFTSDPTNFSPKWPKTRKGKFDVFFFREKVRLGSKIQKKLKILQYRSDGPKMPCYKAYIARGLGGNAEILIFPTPDDMGDPKKIIRLKLAVLP